MIKKKLPTSEVDVASVIAPPLAFVINLSLRSGIFPDDWKMAKVIPLHKNGPADNFENYRPISTLAVVSKIIEKIVHTNLVKFLNDNMLLSNQQFGFRSKRSTELAATLFIDDIRRHADNKMLVGCVFIDFSKAFDTLSHAKLLQKLSAYGIKDTELSWFTDYLFNRKQIVLYNGQCSSISSIKCGVPQGSIIGPLLFVIFINDIVDYVIKSSIIKYADDTVLYTPGKDIYIIEQNLSQDLERLAEWFTENEMILNLKKGKTECMLIGTAKRLAAAPRSLEVKYNQNLINVTTTYKYLGVEIDHTLTLNDHFNRSYKKATTRLLFLSKLRSQLTPEAAVSVYNCMILPIITYCSLVSLHVTKTQCCRLKSIDNRAKKIIGAPSSDDIISIDSFKKRNACKFVRKCLENYICENFENYFTLQHHEKSTRNNNIYLKLPVVRTEFARKSAYFMAAKIYNDLPIDIRRCKSFESFCGCLKVHFK